MKYRTIVADPPWAYRNTAIPSNNGSKSWTKERMAAMKAAYSASGQYPTMTVAEISGMPIAALADDNAHLYLWVTNPLLPDVMGICAAWGFRYVTLLTWHKIAGAPGMGFYFRGDTEHVVFGVRGKAPIPPAIRVSNHFAAAKGRHSAKPDRFYEIVERVSPGPYLELFARRRRYGWDVWGNEAPTEQASQAEMGLDAA